MFSYGVRVLCKYFVVWVIFFVFVMVQGGWISLGQDVEKIYSWEIQRDE